METNSLGPSGLDKQDKLVGPPGEALLRRPGWLSAGRKGKRELGICHFLQKAKAHGTEAGSYLSEGRAQGFSRLSALLL